LRRASAVARQALGRARTAFQIATGSDVEKADDFVIQAHAQLCGDDLSLRKFLEICLAENDRRMAEFDPLLPRPTLLPSITKLILRMISVSQG